MTDWYEVYSLVEGTLDESHSHPTYGEALKKASDLNDTIRESVDPGVDWEVYIMPHYCDNSGPCNCSQYLTDHHPQFASAC